MARSARINYGRQGLKVTVVTIGGKKYDREIELDHPSCDYCGVDSEHRTTGFFSYDDFEWQEFGVIRAFCNKDCYLSYLLRGRQTTARKTKLKKALAVIKLEDDQAVREARKATRPKAKSSKTAAGKRHLKSVAA